jgi:hypothetical protein
METEQGIDRSLHHPPEACTERWGKRSRATGRAPRWGSGMLNIQHQQNTVECGRCKQHIEAECKEDENRQRSVDRNVRVCMSCANYSWKQRNRDLKATITIRRAPKAYQ